MAAPTLVRRVASVENRLKNCCASLNDSLYFTIEMGDTRNLSQEIEIKLCLESFTDYLKLLGFLGQVESEEHHVNGFFDTEDRKLAADGWALRVRVESGHGLLTLKSETSKPGVAVTRDQIEVEIPLGEAVDILSLRKDVMALSNASVDFVKRTWGKINVTKLAHFENTRQKKPFRIGDYNYVLELDKTEFADGSVDYELELELSDESRIEIVEDGLRKLFASLGIPFCLQTESKFARALKKTGVI